MQNTGDNSFVCPHCDNDVNKDDDFCPNCGTIFIDNLYCNNHKDKPAKGVCVICSVPYCKKCGLRVNDHFLCNNHSDYEIYEGMARVFGTLDDVIAQFAKDCLEKDGLHPYIFCRDQPQGGPRFVNSLFAAKGDYLGNIVNEIKVMVPFGEVEDAEKILKSVKLIEQP